MDSASNLSYENRKYLDPRERDPDYARRLRELEGQIADLDRDRQAFKMGDYNEHRGGKWEKWIMPGLVTLAVSGIIANVAQAMSLSALRQQVMDLQLEVNRLERIAEERLPPK